MKGWIIIGAILLFIMMCISSCFGVPFELVLFIGLLLLLGVSLFVTLYPYHHKEKEEQKLKQEMPNSTEYFIKGNLKKVVLNSDKLYIRKIVGKYYDCNDIKKVKIRYQVNNEVIHYEDPDGAIKMGAVAGIASWFGIGTIADLDSLGKDVLEQRLTIYIEFSITNTIVNLCAFNEIVKDNSQFDRVKEIVKFVNDLNRIIKGKGNI